MQIVPEGELAYGMQLPVQAQSRMFVAGWERSAGPTEIVRLAQQADRTGFFYVAVCDHVAIPRAGADRMGTTWYDPIATLGMLAGVTTRVRLLSHVYVLAHRHPLVTAKAFATLDHLSGGRVILGVGAGHVEAEFEALGTSFEQRGPLTDEAIDAVAAALTDEFPAVEGPTWSFRDLGVAPRPVQQPRPPIWVGGSSKPALRRAAERGDGWLPQGTPRERMPQEITYLLEHRRAVRGDEPIDLGAITEFLYVGEPGWDAGPGTISGKPEAIATSLRELGAMGVNHLQVRFRSRTLDEQLDQMEAFATEVAPLLDD